MLLRSIRSSLGRYLAILAIVALGVGIFAGLKSSQPAMQSTVDEYMRDNRMFDFQLMSSLGLTESDRAAFAQLDGVKYAEGAYGVDAMAEVGKTEEPYRFMSVTENVSVPLLVAGRMPETDGECLADAGAFSEKDIGKTVQLSEDNDADTLDMFTSRSYKIVGIAKSPRYISNDRGSTSLGSGSLKGFIILPAAAFNSEVYHEILLYCNFDGALFSSEYDTARDKLKPRIQQLLNRCGARRYETLRAETDAKLADAQLEINDGWDEYYEDYPTLSYTRTMNYVEIPFLAHLAFGKDRGLQFFIHAGPQIGFLLGDSEKIDGDWDGTVAESYTNITVEQHGKAIDNKFDYGIAGGAGIELRTKAGNFIVEGRYYYALSDFYGSTKKDFFSRSAHGVITAKITYLFDLKK